MKRKELQAPFLPEYSRMAITKALGCVRLPLQEFANVSEQQAWQKFCNRLLSACRADMPASAETERILKEFRQLLNL